MHSWAEITIFFMVAWPVMPQEDGALLFIKDEHVILLRSCLLIRSYIFHKDASLDFGFLGVDN